MYNKNVKTLEKTWFANLAWCEELHVKGKGLLSKLYRFPGKHSGLFW